MVSGRARTPWLKRISIELAAWILVAAGVAMLVLPGPGMLALVSGLALLSMEYPWAHRLVKPIEAKAMHAAAQGVQTWPRITGSVLSALVIIVVGIVWGLRPPTPGWWPLADFWWLVGGWGTGITLIGSGTFALIFIVHCCRRFRGPQAAAVVPRKENADG